MSGQSFGIPPPRLDLNVSASPQIAVEAAGFWRRTGAVVLDAVILVVMQLPITIVVVALLSAIGAPEGVSNELDRVIGIIATYIYYGYFYSTKGATPGKMVLGLKVLRDETGTHLTYAQAFGREFLKSLLMVFTLTISILIAAFRQDKKALHDVICKTRVVRIVK